MFVYMFEMSNEASLKFRSTGMFLRSQMSWAVFFMLKAYGRGTCEVSLLDIWPISTLVRYSSWPWVLWGSQFCGFLWGLLFWVRWGLKICVTILNLSEWCLCIRWHVPNKNLALAETHSNCSAQSCWGVLVRKQINHLTPNGHFSGRTTPLTYRCCIFYLFNKYTYWIL
jgi:hypothetical protein